MLGLEQQVYIQFILRSTIVLIRAVDGLVYSSVADGNDDRSFDRKCAGGFEIDSFEVRFQISADLVQMIRRDLLHLDLHGAIARVDVVELCFTGFARVRFELAVKNFRNPQRKRLTRNGKPVAVLIAVQNKAEAEQAALGRLRSLGSVFQEAHLQLQKGGGIPHDQFWMQVEESRRAKPSPRSRRKTA